MKPSTMILYGLLFCVLATSCVRDDGAEVICDPGQQERPLKIIFRDGVTGTNLLASGRYKPDSILQVRYVAQGQANLHPVLLDSSGGELGSLVRAGGIWQGCDGVYTPRAAMLDSIFLRLTAMDEDTIVVNSTMAGTVEVFYNGVLRASSPTLDDSKQILIVPK